MPKRSRRQFLRGSMLAAAGLLGSGARAWAQHSDFVPAVIIGSGFGGAVAALRLGTAGIDTVVRERGRRWPIRADGNTFATFEEPDGRAHWLRDRTAEGILGLPFLEKPIDRYVGVLEVVQGNGIYIGAGDVVDGALIEGNTGLMNPAFTITALGRAVHGPHPVARWAEQPGVANSAGARL